MKREYCDDEIIYYLFRHGQTYLNVEECIKGQDMSLKTSFTKLGLIQIDNMIDYFKKNKIEAIFTSDLNRTSETSNIINKVLKIPVYYSKKFRGLNLGSFQKLSKEELLKKEDFKRIFTDYNYAPQDGESINQLNTRVLKKLYNIFVKYNYKRVAIISHGTVISNIKSKISNESFENIDYCIIQNSKNMKIIESGKYIHLFKERNN